MLLGITIAASLAAAPPTLAAARKGFTTKTDGVSDITELVVPAEGSVVEYPGPVGKLRAWLVRPAGEAKKSAAMVWLRGGFPPGGVSAKRWNNPDPSSEQTARQYLDAGMVMLFPTLRGVAGNPGTQESFFGEVDDVAAAVAYVQGLDFVDPQRVYLGGHSTGGTLALLAAELGIKVRGVIAFGAMDDVCSYGQEELRFDVKQARECELRAPVKWLDGIRAPVWLVEGEGGNSGPLATLRAATKNPKLTFILVAGADHFDVLGPVNALAARQLQKGELQLSAAQAQAAFDDRPDVVVSDVDGWSVTLPPGFSERPRSTADERIFAKGPLVVGLQRLKGTIGRDCGDAAKLAKGVTPLHEKWGALDICGMTLVQKTKAGELPVVVLELPLAPRAVNLQITGAGATEAELTGFARKVLAGVKGSTSWK